jgi:anti-sigma regulatory factor (Ser/Thr protein kinase)
MSGRASTPAAQRSRCDRARPAEGGAGTVSRTAAPAIRGPAQSQAPVPVLPSHDQGTTMTSEWPLRDAIEFGSLPGAVPCARLHTRLLLAEWGLAGLIEQAEIVVSELVTNAVAASRQLAWISPVRLWLYADSTRVLIAVWDANPRLPVRAGTDELAESGRGLLLVESLAAQWDAYPTPGYGGKVVRAICVADDSPGF